MEERIKKSRNIADSSLKLYLSNIKRVNGLINGDKTVPENSKCIADYDKIKTALKTILPRTTRKNILTALIVCFSAEKKPDTKLIEKLQADLKAETEKYNSWVKTQKK